MTHYAISYGPGFAEDLRAVNDAIAYFGREQWQKTFGQLVEPGASWAGTPYSTKKRLVRDIRLGCMLAGIRDRPVRAIMRVVIAAHPTRG